MLTCGFCTRKSHSGSPTLAAGALAAVYDGQDDGLALSAVAPQVEEPDRGVGVQPVAAALAHRLQVGLLSQREKTRRSGVQVELDEVTEHEASEQKQHGVDKETQKSKTHPASSACFTLFCISRSR